MSPSPHRSSMSTAGVLASFAQSSQDKDKHKHLFPKAVAFDPTLIPTLEKYAKRLGHKEYQRVVDDVDKKFKIYQKGVEDESKPEASRAMFRQRLDNTADWFTTALKDKFKSGNLPTPAAASSSSFTAAADAAASSSSSTVQPAPSSTYPSSPPPPPPPPPPAPQSTTSSSPRTPPPQMSTPEPAEEERRPFSASIPFDANVAPKIWALTEKLGPVLSERVKNDVEESLKKEKKKRKDETAVECQGCGAVPEIRCDDRHPKRLAKPAEFYYRKLFY